MISDDVQGDVLRVCDVDPALLDGLAYRFGLFVERIADGKDITGSYWGAPEAGIKGHTAFVRGDTPVHSFLHELSHIICMCTKRRSVLFKNAGSDDLEESAVCYLQIVLADCIPGVGRTRLMSDMDIWGYSFRLGKTEHWFRSDADDAREWLIEKELLDSTDQPTFQLRDGAS